MGAGASAGVATGGRKPSSMNFDGIDFLAYKRLEEAYLQETLRLKSAAEADFRVVNVNDPSYISAVIQALQKSYNDYRFIDDDENCIATPEAGGGLSGDGSHKGDTGRDERNKEFLIACGAFHKGKARSNIAKAQTLFSEGVDLNFVDEDGWNALHHACGEGHTNIVEWLLELEEATEEVINLKAADNCTPLWIAAFNGRRDAVMALLMYGADETIKGAPAEEPTSSPALAARRNRQPGLADLLDLEADLRKADPLRKSLQVAKRMDRGEFKESIRSKLVAKEGPA